ncbi:hypothetical protein GCM10010402_41280 [Actinomadura luteofluorescens]|uniref:class I SAM-dependent methyltransferase n=1 Tax=Actinomadura luteofluorescens TaxID=46163 RepID=UPI002164EFBB|nr:class I SAM-dependent methyltransferase [Actinomadura glauciflava]MCR3742641.1 Methyltransferase domain-containing protein [Actinomadura glauciflava]
MLPQEFWNEKHRSYRKSHWINQPNYFAQEVIDRLPSRADLLDAGCGQGQDSAFFAAKGFKVTALDFSEFALGHVQDPVSSNPITRVAASLAEFPHPFEDGSFDVVYAHLSLHYFDREITLAIVREFHRILRPKGLLCAMVNSVDDPEFGEGTRLDADYYELSSGDRKRYFSTESLSDATHRHFAPHLLRQSGRTRKDPHNAFVQLVAQRREGESHA